VVFIFRHLQTQQDWQPRCTSSRDAPGTAARHKREISTPIERGENIKKFPTGSSKNRETIVKQEILRRAATMLGLIASTAMLAALLTAPSAQAQDTATGPAAIPPGTILPVRLNSSLSSSDTKPGQIITARIMQDVPLAHGGKIREGSKVIGHVVDVSSPTDGTAERISLQFDKVISSGRTIPVRTNLRAVAGFMAVLEADVPNGSTDGDGALSTNQVGGDVAYDARGPVTTANNSADVVGKTVKDGVLDQPTPGGRQGRECRGAVDGNNSPEAMWVFSSDACGTYGLSQIVVAHAGRTQPVGVIVLASWRGKLKVPSGTGMLLRVDQ
jgi:hypothetical protein